MSVPNVRSIQSTAAGPRWVHLDMPRHIWHFHLESLRRMLAAAGFEVIGTSHLSLEQGAFGWLSVMVGLVGLERWLFDLVRGRLGKPAAWLALAALWPAGIVAVALALIEAALRRGGAIEILATWREQMSRSRLAAGLPQGDRVLKIVDEGRAMARA